MNHPFVLFEAVLETVPSLSVAGNDSGKNKSTQAMLEIAPSYIVEALPFSLAFLNSSKVKAL